jgi:hypothetical protein
VSVNLPLENLSFFSEKTAHFFKKVVDKAGWFGYNLPLAGG